MFSSSLNHQSFGSPNRVVQPLCSERCQNILFKAVFEHFAQLHHIAALLLASKSFQNSSFGANFLVNFVVDANTISLVESMLSPSSCFSIQFIPSIHINQSWGRSEKINRGISNFVRELVKTKYFHLSLRSLTLDRAMSDDVVSSFFGSCSDNSWPQLRNLSLEACDLTDNLLEIISKNELQLRAVNFKIYLEITDAGLQNISQSLSSITSLDLSYCNKITNAGFEHLENLSNITFLDLCGCGVGDAGLNHVSKLSNLTSLGLLNCNEITDLGLAHISANNLSQVITSLHLGYCDKITDVGLEHIVELTNMTSLDLSCCHLITDVGLELHLAKLSKITSLGLFRCDKISAEAQAKFKVARPNCDIL